MARGSLIIDGSCVAYRAFFAFRGAVVEFGMVSGFLNVLISLAKKFRPSTLIVVWDRGCTQKSQLYPNYRKRVDIMQPEERVNFSNQFKVLEEFLRNLGLRYSQYQGAEADDVIAFLSKYKNVKVSGASDSFPIQTPITIVSDDHDLYALLDDEVVIWRPVRNELVTASSFKRDFGILPQQYSDVIALSGCPADKIPGIKGVGKKSAIDLIREFGSLQSIYESESRSRLVSLVKKSWSDVLLYKKLCSFLDITPCLYIPQTNLGKVRKKLFAWRLIRFIERWKEVETLTQL